MAGFFDVAADEPGRVAIVEPDRRSSTFGEIAADVNRLARGLRARGLRRGDTVAIVSGNRREVLAVYAAAVQTGLYIVLVNWHLTADEIAYLLQNAGATALFAEPDHLAAAAAAADQASIPDALRFVIGDAAVTGGVPMAALLDGQPDLPPEDRSPGQIMFYTSGTTGKPKGVRKTLHATGVAEIALGTGIGVRPLEPDPSMVQLVAGPLYHAAPLAAAVMALDAGARLVLMEHFEAQRFLELIEEQRVTNMSVVPTMFHRLLSLPDEVRDRTDVSSLRAVAHLGAPCSIGVKRRMIDWLGPIITETYAATEGAGTTITSQEWLERPGSVGRPSGDVVVAILDDDGNHCAPGEPGGVFLSQALWKFEYLDDAEKTSANRHGEMFTVGDIGYLDDAGYLFLCDRAAEVIVSGGVNIYPVETEAALLEHPAVADAAVVGVPSDEWGEEVRAVVEPVAGITADDALATELVEHCRALIAHYKCPRAVDFVDALGRDPNGKLRKAAIRDPYWRDQSRKI
ncbi:MAG: AMP-binding protein [Acidimicrobiia bacterium]